MVRVKTEPALVLRRCTAPRRRTIAWHDAMPSTSGRRPAKRKRQDAVFVVKMDARLAPAGGGPPSEHRQDADGSRKDICRVCRTSVRRRRERFQVGTQDRRKVGP